MVAVRQGFGRPTRSGVEINCRHESIIIEFAVEVGDDTIVKHDHAHRTVLQRFCGLHHTALESLILAPRHCRKALSTSSGSAEHCLFGGDDALVSRSNAVGTSSETELKLLRVSSERGVHYLMNLSLVPKCQQDTEILSRLPVLADRGDAPVVYTVTRCSARREIEEYKKSKNQKDDLIR